MELSCNISLENEAYRDLLVYYAMINKLSKFYPLYKELYPDANSSELQRCFLFIRKAIYHKEDFNGNY
jgi:hypothetical protein